MKKLEEKLSKNEKDLRKSFFFRLVLSYVIIFVPLLTLTPYIFFQKAKEVLLERSFEQLITVRENSKEKLKLYFDLRENQLLENESKIYKNLKTKSFNKDQIILNIILLQRIKNEWKTIYQANLLNQTIKEKLINNIAIDSLFTVENDTSYMLCKKRDSDWIFCHEESFNSINTILSLRSGLGKTGEVYLANEDSRLRTKSRFNGFWYKNKFEHQAIQKAFSGITSQEILDDYRKQKVLSAFDLFDFRNFQWAILAEIDIDEVLEPLRNFLPTIISIYLIITIAILIFIFKFSESIFQKALSLNNQVARLKDQQVELTLLSQEKERSKIAMHLHDSIGQNLTYLKMKIIELKNTEMLEVCDQILIELKEISQNIMPSVLVNLGLIAGVRQLTERTNLKHDRKLELTYSQNMDTVRLKDFVEINVFRIIQELLHNSIKHTQNKLLKLNLEIQGDILAINYQEPNNGEDPNKIIQLTVNNRIELLNGTIEYLKEKDFLKCQILIPIKDKFYVAN